MLYRIAYQTPIGWFFWSDENYASLAKVKGLIAAIPDGYKEYCFAVYSDGRGDWKREES